MILIAGGGIGGLAAALSLQAAGVACTVFEQAAEVRELGVGINTLPHAIGVLEALGLLPALDAVGVRTRELVLANRFGQVVWRELRGVEAGHGAPQFSIHRGALLGVLHRAAVARGIAVRTGHRLVGFEQDGDGVTARFANGETMRGAGLVGADGIHSVVRRAVVGALGLGAEGAPCWTGTMLWRGAVEWPAFGDGRTMLIAGGMRAKFVLYPIGTGARPLTNWAVAARVGEGGAPPRREDWNRAGALSELLPFVRDNFQLDRLGMVDPLALIRASGEFWEYPMCDRDPLPGWSVGRVTLLGDAAHPMYPVGSNGASQAVLDGVALARHLVGGDVAGGLAAYAAERGPATAEVVRLNRAGGPERVIDVLEERAPHGFDDVELVAPWAERAAIVGGYAVRAGFAAPPSPHSV